MGTFWIDKKNLKDSNSILDDLEYIYFSDSCLDNMIAFVRENQIRNDPIMLSENPSKIASETVISSCISKFS